MVARVLAALVFTLFAALVFWQAFVHTVHRGTVAVPDLVGRPVDQATRQAHDVGLSLIVEEPGVYTPAVPAGVIAEQHPRAGFHVKTGSSVIIRLGLGGELIRIPDIRGESLQGGLDGLGREGLKAGRRARIDGHTAADRVIATDPPIGDTTAPDTEIDLLVNTAPDETFWVMPSLLSRSREAVRRLCLSQQLRLGQIHRVAYPGLPSGSVIRQYPPAGAQLSRNDIITIWVVQ
jgi:beta-lactam-binding protein with PASTA domain